MKGLQLANIPTVAGDSLWSSPPDDSYGPVRRALSETLRDFALVVRTMFYRGVEAMEVKLHLSLKRDTLTAFSRKKIACLCVRVGHYMALEESICGFLSPGWFL